MDYTKIVHIKDCLQPWQPDTVVKASPEEKMLKQKLDAIARGLEKTGFNYLIQVHNHLNTDNSVAYYVSLMSLNGHYSQQEDYIVSTSQSFWVKYNEQGSIVEKMHEKPPSQQDQFKEVCFNNEPAVFLHLLESQIISHVMKMRKKNLTDQPDKALPAFTPDRLAQCRTSYNSASSKPPSGRATY